MLKFNLVKNWFGIKKLNNCELIRGNTVIYSPNGVMKTSFADSIKELINKKVPKDIFYEQEAAFVIYDNGIKITEKTLLSSINALVFSGEDYNESIHNNPEIAKLVLCNSLKLQYDNEFNKLNETTASLLRLMNSLLYNSNSSKNDSLHEYSTVFGVKNNVINILDSLPKEKDDYHFDIPENSILYNDLFNEKTINSLHDPEFTNKCQTFLEIYKKELNKNIFLNGFTLDDLVKSRDTLAKSNFFSAGHKLLICGQDYDLEKLNNLIVTNENYLYENDTIKKVFNEAKLILKKNKQQEKLVNLIEKNKWIIKNCTNPTEFRKKFILSKLENSFDTISDLKNKIIDIKANVSRIMIEAKKYKSVWDETIEVYNSRFFNKNYGIKIENAAESILGIEAPRFVHYIKNSTKPIDNEIFNRFSTGEKKSIRILNFIFEILVMKQKNTRFAIILDDIADSFDYKNKYAILEYIKNLGEDNDIQLIILTHNFDFYRSIRICLNNHLCSKLIAYNSKDEVTLYDFKNKQIDDYSFLHYWKKSNQIDDIIALIPFCRNIIHIKGNDRTTYSNLCDYLHYSGGNLDFKNLQNPYFEVFNLTINSNIINKNYFETIIEICNNLIKNDNLKEVDLKEKILIGLGIRLLSDKLLFDKYFEIYQEKPVCEENNYTGFLKREVYDKLSNDEQLIYNQCSIVSPSFMHVNSFMYEPLVDVGGEKLVSIYKEIREITMLVKEKTC